MHRKHDRVRYRETDVCAPLSSYGIQKLAAEHYLRLAAFRGQLTATVLRVGNAYGTLLPQHRMQGLIGVAINCVVHGRPVRVFGNPANVRDYIHLDELCNLAERVARPIEEFSILNVGSGRGHSVTDVLGLIEQCYGGAIQVQAEPGCGKWLQDWVVLDITKAQRDFGWFPTVDLRHWNSGHDGRMASRTRTHGNHYLRVVERDLLPGPSGMTSFRRFDRQVPINDEWAGRPPKTHVGWTPQVEGGRGLQRGLTRVGQLSAIPLHRTFPRIIDNDPAAAKKWVCPWNRVIDIP